MTSALILMGNINSIKSPNWLYVYYKISYICSEMPYAMIYLQKSRILYMRHVWPSIVILVRKSHALA